MGTVYDDKSINELSQNSDLVGVLNKLNNNIFEGLRVATLGFYFSTVQAYDSSKKYGIIKVRPFPLVESQKEYTIETYFFQDLSFEDGEIVICIFTDYNFKKNLYAKKPQVTKDTSRHSMNHAVLICGGTRN